MMRSPRTAALLLCVITGLAFQTTLRAQTGSSAPVHVRILMAGGLLGQEDGMPEYPGGPFDTAVGPGMRPYGGMAGLLDWVQKDRERAQPDMFLMTGNNLPREIGGGAEVIDFFRRFRLLQPSAIAVGVEDFLRGLGGEHSHTGAVLVTGMRDSDLPFLLTNAAVRLHQTGLNQIAQNGFHLNVDPDSSIGWVRDLSMTYPCKLSESLKSGVDVTVSRVDQPEPGRSGRLRVTVTDKKPCAIRVSLPQWLSPAARYTIVVKKDAPLASFTVRTDQRLTNKTAIVPDRAELPIVIALADPHVRDILRKAKWRWRADKDAKCDAAECEILLLSPTDAVDAALSFAETTPTSRPVALLSNLEDKDTAAVLQRNPRVRIVVLPADSLALGRAAVRNLSSASPNDRYSGDLGYGAVLNSNTPTAVQIWSRPEWFAESVHTIEMEIDPRTWGFTKAVQESFSVKGRALCARPTGSTGEVGYYLRDWRIENGRTIYDAPSDVAVSKAPYRYAGIEPNVPYSRVGGFTQGNLWTNLDSFAAVALDAMRVDFNADLAVLPASAIDDNWLTYLRDDPHAPAQWPSKVLLERLVFRAGTIVKVRLSKADLFKKLPAMIAATRQGGGTTCLSGFGISACGSADLKEATTFINDRRADKNRFYTVAMPETVALENDLPRYGDEEADLLYMMDRVFAKSTTTPPDTCSASDGDGTAVTQGQPAGQAPLATRLERARAGRNMPYLFVKPAEFSFSQILVDEPPNGQGLLNKLTVPNNGAKPSRRTSVKADADYGIIDTPQYALRALGSMAYGRAQVNGQSSTDPNLAKLGGRFDWKVRHRGRVFGGVSWETQFANQLTQVTPTSKGVTGPTLPLVTLRRDYRFAIAGWELENPKLNRWFSLEPLGVSVAFGTSAYEHIDIAVNGERLGLAAFQKLGATGLLNQYFSTHPDLSPLSTYAFIDEPQRRTRVQIDVTPRIALPFPGRPLDLTLETTYRRFVGPNLMPLAERQSAVTKVTLAIPLYGLATLNLNTAASFSQVNGIDGWFRVVQPSISLSIPLIGSRHAGWVF